jgi:hypothetical protein
VPQHQRITTCVKGDGALHLCPVCGASEGSLTTDCPGTRIDYERQREIYETNLDYTDARGWHLASDPRGPRFEEPKPPTVPTIDRSLLDQCPHLQRELAQKAIAWVLAERACEDQAATLTRREEEGSIKQAQAKVEFHLASQNADRCDDEFRQAAQKIVAALEEKTTQFRFRQAAGLCTRCGSEEGSACLCYAR